jgi:hypothetical protein
MSLAIVPYAACHAPAVKAFNERLRAAGAAEDLVFYEDPVPVYLPPRDGIAAYNEYFVALEGDTVRAGYALKHQDFLCDGEVRQIACYHHVLSEGAIDRAYSTAGVLALRDALARQPLLYCLGMDGYDRPLPRMLKTLRWSDYLVPFYFHVLHPQAFLKQIEVARQGTWRRWLMDFAAVSGAGWIALKGAQRWKQWRAGKPASYTVEEAVEFGDWADEVWRRARQEYSMAATRNAETLRALYPAAETHLIRLRVARGGKTLGWAVVGERRKNPKFGNLRVGSLIDCFAAPEDALPVVRAAVWALEGRGMDVVFSNQSHEAWQSAFKHSGFFEAASNFIFAASPKLSELLSPFAKAMARAHLTRADGDGLPRNF